MRPRPSAAILRARIIHLPYYELQHARRTARIFRNSPMILCMARSRCRRCRRPRPGYHEHHGVKLDEKLDDFSPAGIQEQHQFYSGFRDRLALIKPETLTAEERADYQILQNQIDLSLLDLREIHSFRHNPTVYVELVGNALFNPFVLEYAPIETRYRDIIQRLFKVPALMEQAKTNLTDSPEVWNRVAQEENDGNIGLIDQTLRASVPAALKADFDRAAGGALTALRDFNNYLKTDLSRKTSDWRLGKDKYDKKFRYSLVSGKTPEQVLAEAEAALKNVRDEMAKLAAPRSVQEALNKIAQQHATPDTFMDQARKDLEEATNFVREKHLVTLPARGNLQVIPTPEFMRGIYGVAGFNPAPALEPQLGAFYWVTPIPANWPKERIESKLREYNTYGLMEITIHEAMPGHYVQFEVADGVEPKSRRVLRNHFRQWTLCGRLGYLCAAVDVGRRLPAQQRRVAPDAVQAIAARDLERDPGYPPADHGHDRSGGHGPDGPRYLPGKRRSHREIAARAIVVLPVADVLHRLAWLAGRPRSITRNERARLQSHRVPRRSAEGKRRPAANARRVAAVAHALLRAAFALMRTRRSQNFSTCQRLTKSSVQTIGARLVQAELRAPSPDCSREITYSPSAKPT